MWSLSYFTSNPLNPSGGIYRKEVGKYYTKHAALTEARKLELPHFSIYNSKTNTYEDHYREEI